MELFDLTACVREANLQPVVGTKTISHRRKVMKCPICNSKTRVEIDTHSDGYAENLQECGACGALWICRGDSEIILHGAEQAANE